MRYEKTLIVSSKKGQMIRKLLANEPKTESDCFGENEKESDEIYFDNGIRFVVELCGVQYGDNEDSNLPWTQALLYDENGSELTFTEPEDTYFGLWELEYNDDIYAVTVLDYNPDTEVSAEIRFVTCTTAEAIEEINIQLDAAHLPHVTENDLIESYETEHEEDWFDDYMFVFHKIFTGNTAEIIKALNDNMDDVSINED